MKNFRMRETVKNIILCSLVILMVVLIRKTWGYGLDMKNTSQDTLIYKLFSNSGTKNNQEISDIDDSVGAYPVIFAVQNKEGMYGKRFVDTRNDFEAVSAIIKQAFENSEEFLKTTSYGETLQKQLVFVEYEGSIPVDMLAEWVNARINHIDLQLGSFLVAKSENNYDIFIKNKKDGSIYTAKTSVNDKTFFKVISEFPITDYSFAKIQGYNNLPPETLVSSVSEKFSILEVFPLDFTETGGQGSKQELLEAFGYNPYTAKSYYDNTGKTVIYVERQSTLSINETGKIIFEATGILGGIDTHQNGYDRANIDTLRIAKAGDIINKVLVSIGGGQAYLTNAYYNTSGNTYEYIFSLFVSGVPVDDKVNGYFAKMTFKDDKLIKAVLNLKQYNKTNEVLDLLPGKQLQEIIDAKYTSIRYTDVGEKRILPQWKYIK